MTIRLPSPAYRANKFLTTLTKMRVATTQNTLHWWLQLHFKAIMEDE